MGKPSVGKGRGKERGNHLWAREKGLGMRKPSVGKGRGKGLGVGKPSLG